MADLFDSVKADGPRPLADLLRPETLDEMVGQRKLLAHGSLLRRHIAERRLGNIILFGRPGIGKTTMARAIGKAIGKEFRAINATDSGLKEVRQIADEARMKPILLFIDEIHRFTKAQCDALLADCEKGTFDFISGTTENPYHAVHKALLSRSMVMKLEPLDATDMEILIDRAITHLHSSGKDLRLTDEQRKTLAGRASGDARNLLNMLESLSMGHPPGPIEVTREMIEEIFQAAPVIFDRNGDEHYDIISVFIKSMRGSDPDATLYWLARLVNAGEDPRYIARRMMVHASEDIGLSDNTALQTAVAAAQAVEKIGYPEARIILAHAALHIALAPKSGSAYQGIGAAEAYVASHAPIEVPLYLRDAHYAGAAALGHKGYISPHSDPRGWNEQDYAPGIRPGTFYRPGSRSPGSFELRAAEYWEKVTGRKG
ncbi:replication-associated recombination protein A [Paracoccus litorisediminis]|uniref:replication-associated recombination protein A n=1 Tax=Paracoccus litorisediminis TaxID=2006130 RepID=UPI0037304996